MGLDLSEVNANLTTKKGEGSRGSGFDSNFHGLFISRLGIGILGLRLGLLGGTRFDTAVAALHVFDAIGQTTRKGFGSGEACGNGRGIKLTFRGCRDSSVGLQPLQNGLLDGCGNLALGNGDSGGDFGINLVINLGGEFGIHLFEQGLGENLGNVFG